MLYNITDNIVGNKNVGKGFIMFIGRNEEIKILKEKLNNNNLEVGVIYGQRRIGKTSLIKEVIKSYDSLYFLARDTSLQENLNEFNRIINNYFHLPSFASFASFDTAFDYILDEIKTNAVIVIDELPFLAKVYPGIVSYLQGIIDECKTKGKIIKLLLSGSDSSFMVDLLTNRAKPLYQRATFKIHVGPMLFSDAKKMLDGLTSVDKARYLSIFGNRPYYLEKIDKEKDFDDNMIRLCFSNTSILIDAPNMTLPIGYSSNSTYTSILMAISNRKHKIQDIASYLHIDDKSLSTYLKRMLDAEVIEKRDIFNGNKKTVYYEISDSFIRFYYSVIYLSLPDIERGYKQEIYESSKEKINKIIEHGFEDVSNSYIHELNINHKLPFVYHDVKKYVADNSILRRSIEIDGISESFDKKHLLIVEAKYRDKDISKEIYDHLVESASIFKGYKTKSYYLISKKGFSDNIRHLQDNNLHLITLDQMMGEC